MASNIHTTFTRRCTCGRDCFGKDKFVGEVDACCNGEGEPLPMVPFSWMIPYLEPSQKTDDIVDLDKLRMTSHDFSGLNLDAASSNSSPSPSPPLKKEDKSKNSISEGDYLASLFETGSLKLPRVPSNPGLYAESPSVLRRSFETNGELNSEMITQQALQLNHPLQFQTSVQFQLQPISQLLSDSSPLNPQSGSSCVDEIEQVVKPTRKIQWSNHFEKNLRKLQIFDEVNSRLDKASLDYGKFKRDHAGVQNMQRVFFAQQLDSLLLSKGETEGLRQFITNGSIKNISVGVAKCTAALVAYLQHLKSTNLAAFQLVISRMDKDQNQRRSHARRPLKKR